MIQYKNISFSAKTFYGVKFEPGEIKAVPGFINSPRMLRIPGDLPNKSPSASVTPEEPAHTSTRGRKKKVNESEKTSNAETEIKLETQEEISDGNYS